MKEISTNVEKFPFQDAVVESIDWEASTRLYCWLRMPDGTAGLWAFELSSPPGHAQSFGIVEGA